MQTVTCWTSFSFIFKTKGIRSSFDCERKLLTRSLARFSPIYFRLYGNQFRNLGKLNQMLDLNYTFPIELVSNGIIFSAKLIRKTVITCKIWFNLTKFKNLILFLVTSISATSFAIMEGHLRGGGSYLNPPLPTKLPWCSY